MDMVRYFLRQIPFAAITIYWYCLQAFEFVVLYLSRYGDRLLRLLSLDEVRICWKDMNFDNRTEIGMENLQMSRIFTLIEPGPVVLVTTNDRQKDNVMTISWTMVLDFTAQFAITTGPWNHSYIALQESRECVISISTVDLIDTVAGVGTCSGTDTDKFTKFKLTRLKTKYVRAPIIKECLANIECRVVDIVTKYNIVVLEGVAPYFDNSREEKKTLHAVGDCTFIVDGRKIDRKKMMQAKLPSGI